MSPPHSMPSRPAFATKSMISLGFRDRKLTETKPVCIKHSLHRPEGPGQLHPPHNARDRPLEIPTTETGTLACPPTSFSRVCTPGIQRDSTFTRNKRHLFGGASSWREIGDFEIRN